MNEEMELIEVNMPSRAKGGLCRGELGVFVGLRTTSTAVRLDWLEAMRHEILWVSHDHGKKETKVRMRDGQTFPVKAPYQDIENILKKI
jgi:hypothetical protein